MRLSRRRFLAGAGAVSWRSAAKAQSFQAMVHCALEWTLTSAKSYGNPFTDVELDVIVRDPEGAEFRVPAFWAGGQTWRVRYAPAKSGAHTWLTVSSDAANSGLQGQSGTIDSIPYQGSNPL